VPLGDMRSVSIDATAQTAPKTTTAVACGTSLPAHTLSGTPEPTNGYPLQGVFPHHGDRDTCTGWRTWVCSNSSARPSR
jgi:hypothetical protein